MTTNKLALAIRKDGFMSTEANTNRAEMLDGRKKEIWEMAVLMADEESPSDREIALNLVHARDVVDGIDNVMKWVTGETGGAMAANLDECDACELTFKQKIERWKRMAEEIADEKD